MKIKLYDPNCPEPDWYIKFKEEWKKNPPRLLSTFGHRETELAAIKILDNCDENGCVDESLFPNGRGLYDLGDWIVEKKDNKWCPRPEFWERIKKKHPEEFKRTKYKYEQTRKN